MTTLNLSDKAELEGKLLAALDGEAAEMGQADWDRLRERVRQSACTILHPAMNRRARNSAP